MEERLPRLREINISNNKFAAVPRALAGVTSLEKIDLSDNIRLQVKAPLDFLEWPLQLRELQLKMPRRWPRSSRAHLAELAAKLRVRHRALQRPETKVEF